MRHFNVGKVSGSGSVKPVSHVDADYYEFDPNNHVFNFFEKNVFSKRLIATFSVRYEDVYIVQEATA